jgi:hypothetical protein
MIAACRDSDGVSLIRLTPRARANCIDGIIAPLMARRS